MKEPETVLGLFRPHRRCFQHANKYANEA